jgi:hypothetical protein
MWQNLVEIKSEKNFLSAILSCKENLIRYKGDFR